MVISLEEFSKRYLNRPLEPWQKLSIESISEGRQFTIAMPRKSGVSLFRKALADLLFESGGKR